MIPPQGTTTQKLTENERTFEMKTELEKCLDTERFTIRADTRNSRKYCPFRGGGDISKSGNCSAVITTSEEEEEEEEEEGGRINVTPPQPNERRCVSIENKASGVQRYSETVLQLQANMVLTCATVLEYKLELSTAEIDSITCYGLLVGMEYPVTLVKLTIDFIARNMLFEQLCRLRPDPFHGARIDMALNYLCESLMNT